MSFVRFRVESFRDDGPFQSVTGRGEGGERLQDLLRIQPDGFTTAPKKGALGVAMFDGSRTRGVVMGLELDGDRPKGTAAGDKVLYGPNGQILKAFGSDWRMNSPNGVFEGKGRSVDLATHSGALLRLYENGDIAVKPKPGGKVWLGGEPGDGPFAIVATMAGPSLNVMARI